MVEMQKNADPQPISADDGGRSLLPMLIIGIVLIVIGYAGVMIFV